MKKYCKHRPDGKPEETGYHNYASRRSRMRDMGKVVCVSVCLCVCLFQL